MCRSQGGVFLLVPSVMRDTSDASQYAPWDCRAYQERGVVDGWGLLHSLLADVIADVVGAASKEAASATAAERDAWTLIASLAAEPARENCMGGCQTSVAAKYLGHRRHRHSKLGPWLPGV